MRPNHHLPEEQRNRLLRRVDWRFLLPNPEPERSICFANGLLKAGVTLISQETIPATRYFDEECDLAVAVNPTQSVLQTAERVLRPDGTLYVEWYRPWSGGPQGVRRRLNRLGFGQVACYWPWPWPTRANPLFWLPLEAPAALRYFLANRPQAATNQQRLLQRFSRRLWQVGMKTPFVTPICVVARKPGLADGTPKADDADGIPTHQLLLTGGLRSINKVVKQVFADQEQEPRLVIKQARVPESIPALAREVRVLQALQQGRKQGLPGAPRVLSCQQSATSLAVGETVLRGVPIWTTMNHANYRQLAMQATEWLVALAGTATPQPPAAWWQRLVGTALLDFGRNFGAVLDPGQVQATRAHLQQLGDFPLVCEHRDFAPWNVLLAQQGELAVLDWESAELQGLPGLDLIYFLTYLTFFLDGAMASKRYLVSYRAMVQPATPTGAVFHECMAYYARRLGLDPNSLQRLRLLVWLIHARSEYQQFCAETAGSPSAELLAQSLFVQLWQEELQTGRHN